MPGRRFVHSQPIAFGDVDWARILYYPRFLHYCHVAFEAFAAEAFGMPYAELLGTRHLGLPTVHVEVDYRRPMPYGLLLRTSLAVERLGRTSLVIVYEAGSEETGLHASARVTNVVVDMRTFEPQPIPSWMRTALEPWIIVTD